MNFTARGAVPLVGEAVNDAVGPVGSDGAGVPEPPTSITNTAWLNGSPAARKSNPSETQSWSLMTSTARASSRPYDARSRFHPLTTLLVDQLTRVTVLGDRAMKRSVPSPVKSMPKMPVTPEMLNGAPTVFDV